MTAVSAPSPPVESAEARAWPSLRAVVVLLWLSACVVVLAWLGRLTPEKVDWYCRKLGKSVVDGARMRLSVEHEVPLDPAQSYLLMSNHESLIDIPLLFHTAPRPPRMVTKKELFRVPIWGRALKVAEFIAIDRKDRHKAIESLKIAAAIMQRGITVWIAPEGTRSRDGSLLPFKKGGFMLALDTGATIVPVGLYGARNVIRAKRFRTYMDQRVIVRYGTPIDSSEYGVERREELMERVRTEIERLRRPPEDA